MTANIRGVTVEERFLARLESRGDCVVWAGAPDRNGYGAFWDGTYTAAGNPKVVKAHRYAWLLVRGSWPEKALLHSCDNPPCVRIEHLREGTQAENVDDMKSRGRSATGERNGSKTRPERLARGEAQGGAKLTWVAVREMRTSHTGRRGQQAAFARQYGVGHETIRQVLSGKTWVES